MTEWILLDYAGKATCLAYLLLKNGVDKASKHTKENDKALVSYLNKLSTKAHQLIAVQLAGPMQLHEGRVDAWSQK